MKNAAKRSAGAHLLGTTVLQPGQSLMPACPPTESEIRERAYAIYQRRGGASDHALDDWLQAERGLQVG